MKIAKRNIFLLIILICTILSGCKFKLIYNDNNEKFDPNNNQIKETVVSKPTEIPRYDTKNHYIRNNLLDDIEMKIYDAAYVAMTNKENTLSFDTLNYTFSSEDEIIKKISNSIYAVLYDNPDIFWYDNNFSYSYDESLNACNMKIQLKTIFKTEEITKIEKEINAVSSLIYDTTQHMDEYEKSKYIYEYLAQNTTYKYSENNKNIYNIYGTLINSEAVCEGYAKAYCYLMKKCGMEATVITGISHTEEHAWNLAKINGKWYYVDCTWADPVIDLKDNLYKNNYVDYSYLHLRFDDISNIYTFDELYKNLPEYNNWDENYFIKEDLFFTNFNKSSFKKVLYNEINKLNSSKGESINFRFKNPHDAIKASEYLNEIFFDLSSNMENEIVKFNKSISEEMGTIKILIFYK